MKKGKKSKIIIAAVVIIVIGTAGAYAVMGNGIDVSTATASYGGVEKLINETGSVEAKSSAVVSSKIQGQLASVNVKEGDEVAEGQLLAAYTATGSAASDISGIRAQISGLNVQLNQAKDSEAKNKRLYEEGALSYEEYSNSISATKQIETQIASLNYSIISLSETASEAGGSKGVTAPISGTVTSVMIKEGETVSPGAPMIEISDASEIYIKVNLVSEDADEINSGAQVRVFSENEKLLDDSAVVSKIFVKAQDVLSDLGISQKRVPVEITLSVEKNLRLGSNVNLEIIADMRENVLIVPENSVFEINKQKYVYKIENGKAGLQNVETGLEGEKYTEILGGLSNGDVVIMSPPKELEDGKKVKTL